jgi:hypothetical protein
VRAVAHKRRNPASAGNRHHRAHARDSAGGLAQRNLFTIGNAAPTGHAITKTNCHTPGKHNHASRNAKASPAAITHKAARNIYTQTRANGVANSSRTGVHARNGIAAAGRPGMVSVRKKSGEGQPQQRDLSRAGDA